MTDAIGAPDGSGCGNVPMRQGPERIRSPLALLASTGTARRNDLAWRVRYLCPSCHCACAKRARRSGVPHRHVKRYLSADSGRTCVRRQPAGQPRQHDGPAIPAHNPFLRHRMEHAQQLRPRAWLDSRQPAPTLQSNPWPKSNAFSSWEPAWPGSRWLFPSGVWD